MAEGFKVEKGDRFTDRDWRNEGRVIQVRRVHPEVEKVEAQVETHPNNPEAVGRFTVVSYATLAKRYRKVSR